jgi:rare lipoprotein A
MTARFPWFAAFFVPVFIIVGCAGRRPAATSVPSAPASQPAPEETTPPPTPTRPPTASQPSEPPTRNAPFIPGIYVEEGIASWYGVPFNGRRAADGEIFDMNTLVAAHRTLPFGSIVRVTNLNNGRQIDVRVIDRGPFVGNRVLDLARAAAAGLDMIGTGTAPVRIQLIASPSTAGGEYTVQVGAFAEQEKAERLRERLLAKYQPIYIQELDGPDGHFYRVRVGSFSTPDAAQQVAGQLRKSDGFQTFVLRLDLPAGLNVK